jgi:hypothetical protein
MDNFIDQLNSTLNKANRNDIDDDIKDEILDDLEEEALQTEGNEDDDHDEITKKNTIYNQNKSSVDFAAEKPKRTPFFNGSDDFENRNNNKKSYNQDNEDGEDPTKTFYDRHTPKSYDNDLPNSTLGATNHMQKRINSLER